MLSLIRTKKNKSQASISSQYRTKYTVVSFRSFCNTMKMARFSRLFFFITVRGFSEHTRLETHWNETHDNPEMNY